MSRLLTPNAATPPVTRGFEPGEIRTGIFDGIVGAAGQLPVTQNQRYALELGNVGYEGPETYGKRDKKKAIIEGGTMGRKLRGDYMLRDLGTNAVVDQRRMTLATVPYLTDEGTYVFRGNEYTLANQLRLRPGVFTRRQASGELESHINVAKGMGHHYYLDPETGIFRVKVGQARMPMLPVLKALGAKESDIRKAWGNDLWFANAKYLNDEATLKKLHAKFRGPTTTPTGDPISLHESIRQSFGEMELDPEVTKRTLGQPYSKVDPEVILAATRKLMAVNAGEADEDDRDAMQYQRMVGADDLFAERLRKGMGDLRRAFWKASMTGKLDKLPPGVFDKAIRGTLLDTGLGNAIEAINPAELLDHRHRVTRMGEGGIGSSQAVPMDSRSVQPSHLGFIDPSHTPESGRIGVDMRLSVQTRKGKDGRLYARYKTPEGEVVWRSPQDLADSVVSFPGELASGEEFVRAIDNGHQRYVKRDKVGYELDHMGEAFGPLSNLVPLKGEVFPQRTAMGARMATQALPLVAAEAPLVQSGLPGGQQSYEELYGKQMGAVASPVAGTVVESGPGFIKIRGVDRRIHEVELADNIPHNRKTFSHNTPVVKPGDRVTEGQVVAQSNFTDKAGVTALGKNLRVAYVPFRGANYEDAIVMSESAARKMTSEHAYQQTLDLEDGLKHSKHAFVASFPGKYDKKILANFDDDGVIKPGSEVKHDDPLILAVKQRKVGPHLGRRQRSFADASVTWDHHAPGVVTDVFKGKKGLNVIVKSVNPTEVGDKFAGRYGDKGVVAEIVPDHQMPTGADGKPFEVLLNPLGIIARGNPGQVLEASLGKIAAKRGQPYRITDFDDARDMRQWVQQELQQHGLESTETLVDPDTGRKIPKVLTGNRFIMKLHHTAEAKAQGRGTGAYTSEGAPAKGGKTGSKRIGMLDLAALLSHGAHDTIRDATLVRGQKNEDYWRQVMSGYDPPQPEVPFVYTKFVEQLKGAGINPVRTGTRTNLMAMTASVVDQLVGDREIQNVETVDWKSDRLAPKKGGLFDEGLTGGHGGNRWSYIGLDESMPSPVTEEPIKRLLGLTEKDFRGILSGREQFRGETGPAALKNALENFNVEDELKKARAAVTGSRKTARDQAIRRLKFLKGLEKNKQHPRDWMMQKVPVLPPAFRAVSRMASSDVPLVADANFLYKELFEADRALRKLKPQVDDVGDERLAVYDAFKGVTGLGDPIQPQHKEQKIKGILKSVFGTSPKFGTVQRKLLSSTVDLVGRATITPNAKLDIDSVRLPQEHAWEVYRPFVMRRMVKRGVPRMKAMQMVQQRDPAARKALLEEMKVRPVYIGRAPVLHRYGIMAFWPELSSGNTLEIPPLVTGGFGADFDGDAMQFNVPSTDKAVRESIEKLMPSRNLIASGNFDVHYLPSHEYVGGLYEASVRKDLKKPARVFKNAAVALAAYRRGEVDLGQRVEIMS